MPHRLPLIHQIQADAVNSSISVVQLVMTAKIAASKLNITQAIDWINNELNGYPSSSRDDLPAYRHVRGDAQAWNPYNGWIPLFIDDGNMHNSLTLRGISQPIGSLETLDRSSGELSMRLPHGVTQTLNRLTGEQTKYQIAIPSTCIDAILVAVRTLVLNWSLELESAGIIGENMSFRHDERQAAQTLNQTIFVQNAGVIGNVSDQASVSISQTANIDAGQAKQLLNQITSLIQQLPEDLQAKLAPVIKQSSECLSQNHPDQGRLRKLLVSARTICEGAAGNILATGIATSIAGLL